MGNVGQHYFKWRYHMEIPAEPAPLPGGDYMPIGPAPYGQAYANDGQSWVLIGNQSPYPLTVQFDGPTSQTMTIPACPGCPVYPNQYAVPACIQTIPTQELLLAPGNYRVTFTYASATVIPGASHWTLTPDTDYAGCYVVINMGQSSAESGAHALPDTQPLAAARAAVE
jgi:hypothetical protein